MLRFMYRSLLRLHPAGFRRRFSEEMLSIFDQEGNRGAAKLVADVFISFCRQWALRSEYWEDKERETLHSSADGVPVFYTLQSSAPRTSALIDGAIVTALMFLVMWGALQHNWTHPVYLRFSGAQFEIGNEDLQPAVSPILPDDATPVSGDRATNTERAAAAHDQPTDPSSSVQPQPSGLATSNFEAVARPVLVSRPTPFTTVHSYYSVSRVTPQRPETVQHEHQFAAQMALGRLQFLRGDYSGAAAHYRVAMGMRPNDPDAIFGMAQALEKSGRAAEAQSVYRAYLKAAPDGRFAEQCSAAIKRLEQSAPR